MLNFLKFWKREEPSCCENPDTNTNALISGLEYGLAQVEQNRQDLGILVGGLLIATGNSDKEFVVKHEFIKAFLENNLTVRYEPNDEGMKIWLEVNEEPDNNEGDL